MNIWMLTDDAGRVLALNPNDMTGNSGWSKTTMKTLGLTADADLHDAHGAVLYEVIKGKAALRSKEERIAEWPEETLSVSAEERIALLEQEILTMREEVRTVVEETATLRVETATLQMKAK